MALKNIQAKAENLVAEFDKVETRREQWNQVTKGLILKTLEEVQGSTKLKWTANKIEHIKNNEFVYIKFYPIDTGIRDKTKAYSIKGGL